MTTFTRRDVLASSVCLMAPSLLTTMTEASETKGTTERLDFSDWGITAVGPREQLLFDFDWKFTFGHGTDPTKDLNFGYGQADFNKTGEFAFAKAGYDVSTWRTINLPHDWGVELPFAKDDSGDGDNQLRKHGYKPLGRRYPETSVGWYRREFLIEASDAGKRITIEFDGAFRNVLVFINGCYIGRNDNGYVPFRFDISDFLNYGSTNVIAIRVDASQGEGWFYEGAGIYRHIWLLKTNPVHLLRWESIVRTSVVGKDAKLDLIAKVRNQDLTAHEARVQWSIMDAFGKLVATTESDSQMVAVNGEVTFAAGTKPTNPLLWSLETPTLYTAIATVISEQKAEDSERVAFGVRSIRFDADRGFFLNDQHVKLKGTCNHHDHAGVGAALPDALQWFRLSLLKEMGCNAVRTSHNMPTPEWVEACDRMGIMMMCETRQLSANPEGLSQLETMIKRYRNSPSIIIWSIGNEESQLQKPMAQQGKRIAETMVRLCHELDPTRKVTAAVNSDNEQGVSDPLDVIGFNYVQWFPEGFHARHPHRPIMGSETSSAISVRGEYSTDKERHTMNSYDGCVPWGQLPEDWWKYQMAHEWEAGGFAWTGFDYRGEPTPYEWPTNSSLFGIMDLCGFPKDFYYYYKAWWRNSPGLHLFPHWNWAGKEGTTIPVWVYTNLDEVELFLNGKRLGKQPVPPLGHLVWNVKYAPGRIEARGYKSGKLILTQRRETTGDSYSIRLSADRNTINADGEDVVLIKVEALDKYGRAVPNAQDALQFTVSGSGKLIGVGNGNPNSLELDKAPKRALFNGLAQIIIQSTKQQGKILVEARCDETKLIGGKIVIDTNAVRPRPFVT